MLQTCINLAEHSTILCDSLYTFVFLLFISIHESRRAFYHLCDSLCTFVLLLFMKPSMNHAEHSTICCAHLYSCYLLDHTWIKLSILLFVWFLAHICIPVIYKSMHESHRALYHLCDPLCTFVFLLLIRPYMNHVEHSTICVICCAHLYYCYL